MHSLQGTSRNSLRALGLELRRSRLGLLDGLGALRLQHDASGSVVGGAGVWCPTDDELDHQDLLELFRPGVALTYRGPVWRDRPSVDAALGTDGSAGAATELEDVELEVEVSTVERLATGAAGSATSTLVGL